MDKISALMDGEMDDRQASLQLARLKQEIELIEGWNTYHIIGDALRGDPVLSQSFGSRFSRKLSEEPTVLAPQRSAVNRFTTYALSAAASLSAVALVGWIAFHDNPLKPQPAIIASSASSAPAPTPATSPQLASVPSDGLMSEYLIAHQEFSPSTSIQGVAPYIRTVSGAKQDKEW